MTSSVGRSSPVGAGHRDGDACRAPGLTESQPELEGAIAPVDEHERGIGRRVSGLRPYASASSGGPSWAVMVQLAAASGQTAAKRSRCAARVVVEEVDREPCPSARRGEPPPVADRLHRERFGERASADDPEVDVVVRERVPAHHVPQETLRGVLPLVEEVDVGLLAAEPVTDQHVAPQELAQPEVAHPHEAARRDGRRCDGAGSDRGAPRPPRSRPSARRRSRRSTRSGSTPARSPPA